MSRADESTARLKQAWPGVSLVLGVVALCSLWGCWPPAGARDGPVTKAKLQIAQFKAAVTKYYIDTGVYPSEEEGLDALIARPGDATLARHWKGPYVNTDEIPRDPWGNAYVYRSPGSGDAPFEILSLGRDGKEGGEGLDADISSRRLHE